VVYGNVADEMALFKQIAEENAQYSSSGVCTCVLYPSSTAVSLNEWLSCHTSSDYSDQGQSTHRPDKKLVRLILLDGTYIQANKQYKHLLKCNDVYKLGLTFVKLDFDGEGGCNSAMSKITKQPDEVKICTYEAAIMAVRQVVGDRIKSASYDSWYRYLDTWIAYMLSSKVKQGESKKEKEKGPIESPQKVSNKTHNLHQAAEEDVIRGNLKLAGSNDISEGARDILATINLFRNMQRTVVIKMTNKFAVYELNYDANI
jgi:DTW domain-containing protein YfiP